MRLDELQAALLKVKLDHLDKWTSMRKEIAEWYNDELKDLAGLTLPVLADSATHVYHLYVVRTGRRDELQEYLAKNEVGSLIHYPVPPHLQKAYRDLGFKKGDFPIAEEIHNTCLSLPLWPGMAKDQVKHIASLIKKF